MKRTTGPRSQSTHLHGHCSDIAEQEKLPKALVYQWVCLLAVSHDLIDAVDVFDASMPRHESEWTSAQCAAVIEMVHAEADVRGWWLTEFVDGIPQKVRYGAERVGRG